MQQPEDHPVRGFLQIGFFLAGGGFLLAIIQPRENAEFVVSVCSGVMGLFIITGSMMIARWMRPGE